MGGFSLPARLAAIEPSQIRENMRIAKDVGAINLAQGRPDFPTAAEVKLAAIKAIAADHNQYSVTWGIEPLRDAVANMLADRFGLDYDPETDVTITCGVTEAIVAAMHALLGLWWPSNRWTRAYRQSDMPPDQPRDVRAVDALRP